MIVPPKCSGCSILFEKNKQIKHLAYLYQTVELEKAYYQKKYNAVDERKLLPVYREQIKTLNEKIEKQALQLKKLKNKVI